MVETKQFALFGLDVSQKLNIIQILSAEKEVQDDIPYRLWQKPGTDLFSLEGHDYVQVTDYYSNLQVHVSGICSVR